MISYRNRKLLTSKFRRAMRWEFWPMWVFYPPVILWILILGIRHRSPLLFTAANPGMKAGGLVDENKAANLLAIQDCHPEAVAKTALVDNELNCREAMNTLGINYPVILKPNSGQRGIGVKIIADNEALDQYFADFSDKQILLQEYTPGLEFGVFYMREPDQPEGRIFSINEKQMPRILGNGMQSLEELILENDRQHYMAEFLLKQHAGKLSSVPEQGEEIPLVEIGSHCRGSVFTEASKSMTPELQRRIDQISKAIPGYFFGRYDLRVPSTEDLQAGKNIKILEANGVSSESANMYDSSYGLIKAYSIIFEQWRMAFHIGKKNIGQGHSPATLRDVLQNLSQINRE